MANDIRSDLGPSDRSRRKYGRRTTYRDPHRRRSESIIDEEEEEAASRVTERDRHRRRAGDREASKGKRRQTPSPSQRRESERVSRYERHDDDYSPRRRWRSPMENSDSGSRSTSYSGRRRVHEAPSPRRISRRSVHPYPPSPRRPASILSRSPSPEPRRSNIRVDSHHNSCEHLYGETGYRMSPRHEQLEAYDFIRGRQTIAHATGDVERPSEHVRRRSSVSGYTRPHGRQSGSFLEGLFGRPTYPSPSMRRPASVVSSSIAPSIAPVLQTRPSMRRSNTMSTRPMVIRPSLARRKELPKPSGMETVATVFEAANSMISAVAEPPPPRPRVPDHHRKRNSGIFSSLGYSAPAAAPNMEETRVECISCLDDVLPRKAAKLDCSHHMCNSCLKRVFNLSITDPSLMPPKCCTDRLIPLRHVAPLFDDPFKRKWNRKYQEYTTKNRMYCPKKGCGEWIKPNHIKSDGATGRQYGTCKRCGMKVCRICNQKWHGRKDCPNDEETKRVVDLAKEEGWQRCYNCKTMVELREGCNHMTCHCTAEFCMICGLKWKTCDCPWFNVPPDPANLAPPDPFIFAFGQNPDPFDPFPAGFPRRPRRNRNDGPMPPPPPPPPGAPPLNLRVFDAHAQAIPVPPPPPPPAEGHRGARRRQQEREDEHLARRLALADLSDEPMAPEAPRPERRRSTARARAANRAERNRVDRILDAIEEPHAEEVEDRPQRPRRTRLVRHEPESRQRVGRGREASPADGVTSSNMAGLDGGRTGAARVRLWRQHV